MNLKKIFLIFLIFSSCMVGNKSKVIVIAHRGASGYMIEHTLVAKAMAHTMNPDYIEQDVVLTKDNVPIVIHDHFLDTVTDVAKIFPKRKRADGRYYAIDFTIKEIKELTLHERTDLKTKKAIFPKRFPVKSIVKFRIPTLPEEIELIQGLNKSRNKNIGIYVELKAPWFHKKEGKNIEKIVLGVLKKYGYSDEKSNCYIQCFDPASLKYLKYKLKTKLKLVLLIADNSWNETPGVDYSKMLTAKGLKEISKYADGIGPWLNQLLKDGKQIVSNAHQAGLVVHPYSFRSDDLPNEFSSFDALLKKFIYNYKIDGLFTDFPDKVVKFLKK